MTDAANSIGPNAPRWLRQLTQDAAAQRPSLPNRPRNRLVITPVKRWWSMRLQWTFKLVAANGEPIDPRETVFNRAELIDTLSRFFTGPIQLDVHHLDGTVTHRELNG